MGSRYKAAVGGAVLLLVAAVGCSSGGSGGSSSSSAGASPAGAGHGTFTIGLLADMTGPGASGNKSAPNGVKAGTYYASRAGYQIKYVIADTGTNPATTLSAAQKLVQQDHVLAVIAQSALTFAAANYFTAHHVPVIGAAQDGPEWTNATNMFSVIGALHTTQVASTLGQLFKMLGTTSLGSVGYSISPISSEAAKTAAASAKAAGVTVGYLNAQFPFGSTNVGPAVLAMKSASVDGFIGSMDPNTNFAMITGLRQSGIDLKAAVLATGYGGDLEQAGKGALNAAQNVYFFLPYEPIEMDTAATKQFDSDLAAAGIHRRPTFAEYNGYVSIGLLVRGLQAAGNKPTQASLIQALSGIHDWNALGLYGSHQLDINDRTNIVAGVDNCMWVTRLHGGNFDLVNGADPICGTKLEGVSVSSSS